MATDFDKIARGVEALQRLHEQSNTTFKAMAELAGINALEQRLAEASAQLLKVPKELTDTLRYMDQLQDSMKPFGLPFEKIDSIAAVSKALHDSARFQLPQFNFNLPNYENLIPKIPTFEFPKIDPGITQAFAAMTERTAEFQKLFSAEAERHRQLSESIFSSDYMRWLLEEERAVGLIGSLGFVPHGALWAHISGESLPDENEIEAFAMELAARVWPELKARLDLDVADCLNDNRLAEMYRQLIKAHEMGLFEAVAGASVGIIERTVFLARRVVGGSSRTFRWLEKEIGELPGSYLNHREFRVWNVLLTHVFSSCYSDTEADSSKYPNRHAVAHGIGAEVASVIDSLNAILLAHFVIMAASAVLAYREESQHQRLDA